MHALICKQTIFRNLFSGHVYPGALQVELYGIKKGISSWFMWHIEGT